MCTAGCLELNLSRLAFPAQDAVALNTGVMFFKSCEWSLRMLDR